MAGHRRTFLAAALVLSSLPLSLGQVDDGHGHEEDGAGFDSRNYTPEQLARIEYLFGQIVCKCPKENWTKSLAGCPDGCANEQKSEVRRLVKEGKSDVEILASQERQHGLQALARTPSRGFAGFYLYVLPFAALLACAVVVAVILKVLTRNPHAANAAAPLNGKGKAPADARVQKRPGSADDEEWDARIEAELKEMD